MSTNEPVLFVSIKPRFAEKILSGEKSVELRRVRPSTAAPGTLVIFYASSPRCEVVGTARIADIDAASPTAIWERHGGKLGLARSEYRTYFAGVSQAVGIMLEDVRPLSCRVPLAELRVRLKGFNPPQSFCYLNLTQADALLLGSSSRVQIDADSGSRLSKHVAMIGMGALDASGLEGIHGS